MFVALFGLFRRLRTACARSIRAGPVDPDPRATAFGCAPMRRSNGVHAAAEQTIREALAMLDSREPGWNPPAAKG
ncbi:MAG: hypothetical protein IPM75_13315 [Candidatus Competibacteraceae bacterium]|nr:hypothetical protein [Candidatus Competibacteraceae bacterium]